MSADPPAAAFDFEGDAALRAPIEAALHQVVDPEMALDIVEIGLVYRVVADARHVHVTMTMTSAACPVGDVIVDDVHASLDRALGPSCDIEVEIVFEPPWTPERLSPRARAFMGW